MRARRALVGGLLATLGVALVAAFAVVNLTGGERGETGHGAAERASHGHGGSAGRTSPVAATGREQALGRTLVSRAGGRTVRLRVFGEVPDEVAVPSGAVPAGSPLRLAFDVGGGAGDTSGAVGGAGGTSGAGGGAGGTSGAGGALLRAWSVPADGGARSPVALDRRAAFLLNTRSGDLVLPAGATGQGHGAHTTPGSGLVGLSPGGGFAWAAKLPPRAGERVAHDGARFLAVPYPGAGRVELVDLLRRTRAGAVRVGGRVGPMAFGRDGGLWAVDEAGGRLVGVDTRTRTVTADVPVGPGPAVLAVDQPGDRALVATATGATLVDLAAGRALDTRALAADAVAAVAARGTFAVAHADGRLSLLPAAPRRLGAPQVMRTGGPQAGTRTLGLAPDGRTALVLNEREDSLVMVDLVAGRLLRRVEAPAPRDLHVVDHFALARSASGTDLTWVDLDAPERSNTITTGPGRGLTAGLAEGEALAPAPAARQVFGVHVLHGRPIVSDEIANTISADVAVVASGALQPTGGDGLEQRTVLERAGRYELVMRLADGTRHTFALRVAEPAGTTRARPAQPRLEARVGAPLDVRFTVSGAAPEAATVSAYGGLTGDLRQVRAPARRVGARGYEATLRFPTAGSFRLELLSEEAGLQPGRGTGAVVRVRRG